MHHPGPPRFGSVGDSIELAPWNPDPDGSFSWSITKAPDESDVTLGEGPVLSFDPDVAGEYQVTLDAPDGRHDLTVRIFPDNSEPLRIELPTDKVPGERADVNRILEDIGPQEDIAPYVDAAGPGRPRVHLETVREEDDVVVTANVRSAPDSEYDDADLDVEFYLDDRDEASFEVDERTARVPVDEVDELARIHAVAVGERHSVADAIRIDGTDDVAIERPNDPPEWAVDATIYEIYARAFAADDVETTFAEIQKRIPYLESLGIDCVWFTPVLETTSPSGYQVQDYFETADDLGTRQEFESLVDALHDAGIRVMFDLVINHSGYNHVPFQMSAANVQKYRDWYLWDDEGDYENYFDWDHLPNFNYESLAVREYLHSVVDEWAAVVDGFRCDVAWGTPHGFWKEVRERVKDEHPDFLLLDEVIPRDAQYHESEFDLHHDTRLFNDLRRIGREAQPASHLLDVVRTPAEEGFPEHALQLRFVENHDFDRYAEECGRAALKAATAAVCTLPGVPMIFYGQERGVEGTWDDMTWRGGDMDLTAFHRRLVEARKEFEVLRRGEFVDVEWEAESDRVVAYGRDDGESRIVVILNFGEGDAEIRLDEAVQPTDLLTEEPADLAERGGQQAVSVESVLLLRSA